MIRVQDHGLVYYHFSSLGSDGGPRHAFFTRLGGVSAPPYASLNVGASVGDEPRAVEANRRRCYAALGLAEQQVVTCYQVHSDVVVPVTPADGGKVVESTDGLCTDSVGLALFLRFADCVPILLYDAEHRAIALVHAGWKGTLAGIAARAVQAMREHYGSRPEAIHAGLGPAIGPCCYEIGPDLAEPFARRFGDGVLRRQAAGGQSLDLPAANARVLAEEGVRCIEHAGLCTACRVDEFFSHRQEGGQTGRLAALAVL
ncbi:MAG: peptidoglycan editing factor PgeF [Anaerolineae bacterium]